MLPLTVLDQLVLKIVMEKPGYLELDLALIVRALLIVKLACIGKAIVAGVKREEVHVKNGDKQLDVTQPLTVLARHTTIAVTVTLSNIASGVVETITLASTLTTLLLATSSLTLAHVT